MPYSNVEFDIEFLTLLFLNVQYVETFGLMFSMYCISKIRHNAFSVIDVCDRQIMALRLVDLVARSAYS